MDIKLFNEDCIETMKRIPDGSIDLMLTDIPYGTTQNDWDVLPNLADMWVEWERILKYNGVWIFTAQQPVTSFLTISKQQFFRYEWIWQKTSPTGYLNSHKMPLKCHENILVFYRSLPVYNPQKTIGHKRKVSKAKHKINSKKTSNYRNHGLTDYDSTERFPVSIINMKSDKQKESFHPTQKPVNLFRYLIRTYSNEGETVYDGYSGSGTTAVACIKEKRNFIGAEMNKEYFDKAIDRINKEKSKLTLF